MKISDFHQIARQEGRVVLDSKSKEVKTQSLKGRIVSFFQGKSKVQARSAEVKTAFLKAIKESGGHAAAAKARELLGAENKPLTARDVRRVLHETTQLVRNILPAKAEVRQTVADALREFVSPRLDSGDLNHNEFVEWIHNLDPKSREAQAFVALGKSALPGVVKEAFPELDEAAQKFLTEAVSTGVKWGANFGLEEVARNEQGDTHYFKLQSGELQLLLGKAGIEGGSGLDSESDSFGDSLVRLRAQLGTTVPGRLLDGLATATDGELRSLIAESQLTPEEKSSGERAKAAKALLVDEGRRGAVDEILRALRDAIPRIEHSGGDGELPGKLTVRGVEYERGELLGKGGNGAVYRYLAEGGERFVVKQMLDLQNKPAVDLEVSNHRFVNETTGERGKAYFAKLETVARDDLGRLYMVLREEPNGTLRNLIEEGLLNKGVESGLITEAESRLIKKSIMLHLFEGATMMRNELGMMHRDVKPDNIFISKEGRPKFADFGESVQAVAVTKEGGTKTTAYADDTQANHLMREISDDGFALAISMYEVSRGRHPFERNQEMTDHISAHGGLQLEGDLSTGDEALDRILFELTQTDISLRPTVEDILKRPYFDEVRESKDEHLAKLPEIINA